MDPKGSEAFTLCESFSYFCLMALIPGYMWCRQVSPTCWYYWVEQKKRRDLSVIWECFKKESFLDLIFFRLFCSVLVFKKKIMLDEYYYCLW